MAGPDWSLLENPDFAGNALKYRAAGIEDRSQQGERNALRRYATDPQAGIADLMQFDPEKAISLRGDQARQAAEAQRRQTLGAYGRGDTAGARQSALQAGDLDTLKAIEGMDETQRKRAAQSAETLASVGYALRQVPYDQRAGRLAAMGGQLAAAGITPDQLRGFDPTDAAIDAQVGMAMSIKDQIEEANRQRDDRRAQEQFDETKRHNRASEGNAAGNLAERRKERARGGGGRGGIGDVVDIDPSQVKWGQ